MRTGQLVDQIEDVLEKADSAEQKREVIKMLAVKWGVSTGSSGGGHQSLGSDDEGEPIRRGDETISWESSLGTTVRVNGTAMDRNYHGERGGRGLDPARALLRCFSLAVELRQGASVLAALGLGIFEALFLFCDAVGVPTDVQVVVADLAFDVANPGRQRVGVQGLDLHDEVRAERGQKEGRGAAVRAQAHLHDGDLIGHPVAAAPHEVGDIVGGPHVLFHDSTCVAGASWSSKPCARSHVGTSSANESASEVTSSGVTGIGLPGISPIIFSM